ncbi:MAG: hypothetical protein AAF708_18955, partial [Deinococcota bacterium]
SCCSTLAVAYQQAGEYLLTDALYRKYGIGFDVQDIDADGRLEIRTLNTPLNTFLGGADAVAIASPLQILTFEDGNLVDVSQDFPELLRAQLADWQAELTAQVEGPCEVLAAGTYLALRYMLGEGDQAWRDLARVCWLDGASWAMLREALVQFDYAESFTRIDPEDMAQLMPPLDWSLELSQYGQQVTSEGDSIPLLADVFTVSINLPRPHPVYLNLATNDTNYQRLFVGEDVTNRDNALFSLATGIAEFDFGQCYCLTVHNTASHYLFYDSDDLHRFNTVSSVPGQVQLVRIVDTFRILDDSSIDVQDVPVEQVQGRYYLTAWVDYRNENVIDADELKHVVLNIGQP